MEISVESGILTVVGSEPQIGGVRRMLESSLDLELRRAPGSERGGDVQIWVALIGALGPIAAALVTCLFQIKQRGLAKTILIVLPGGGRLDVPKDIPPNPDDEINRIAELIKSEEGSCKIEIPE